MRAALLVFVLAMVALPAPGLANPESAKRRARAYELAYNLDYDEARREMEAAVKADPADVAAERGLAMIPWLMIPFSRGATTVDEFLGSLTQKNIALQSPPKDLAARFATHSARALKLAEDAVAANPKSAAALYELGTTVGLQAAYVATVEGKVLGALGPARRAYNTQERVLKLDPSRTDAGLIVGTYQYVIGSMSFLLRTAASIIGFDGDKAGGVKLIEAVAAGRTEASADAKFALLLLYSREGRHGDALRTVADLQKQFPRNRLLWLEAGATALRAGRAADAVAHLETGMKMLAADSRPRMFGEEALWLLKRGTARVALDRRGDADEDLRRVLKLESRKWVAGRAHAELGKLADLRGDRKTALTHYRQAETIADDNNDPIGKAEAERWIDNAYKG